MSRKDITMNVTFNGDLIILNEDVYVSHDFEFNKYSDEYYPVWNIFVKDKLVTTLECVDYDLQGVVEHALRCGDE